MAEMLFLHAINKEEEPICSLQATSAGVYAGEGGAASTNAAKALQSVGVDLSKHQSQRLTQEIINRSAVIFCMTEAHRYIVENNFDVNHAEVHMMGEFLQGAKEIDVPDPFGQSLKTYQECRDSLVEAIPPIIKFLKKKFSTQSK